MQPAAIMLPASVVHTTAIAAMLQSTAELSMQKVLVMVPALAAVQDRVAVQ